MGGAKLRMGNAESVVVSEADLDGLEAGLRGSLVRPGDPDYDSLRAVWNGMIDRRPGLIVRCEGVSDVISAVNFGRTHDLLIAVRGGGHNVSGNAVCDEGLVIDLSPMKGVRVDPASQTVTAQAGVTIGELDRETQAFGLAVPMGVVTATGIAGLTLGAGYGWLRRKYGATCDNLISADVVTADGRLITAGAGDHSDLLWALKGGGGNFGIVTSFEFRAHPVGPDVFFAFVIHPWSDAHDALRFYREWQAGAPDEISSFAILWHGPEIQELPVEHHHAPIVVFLAMHSGIPEEGRKGLESLRRFGSPLADLSEPMPYLEVQKFFDADYPDGMRYYWKSTYLRTLSDGVVDLLVKLNQETPSPHSTIDIWQLGGASGRAGVDDRPMVDGAAVALVGIEANWEDPADDRACIEWARHAYRVLEPYSTGGEYVNFPGLYEDTEKMMTGTFGDSLERLAEVKNRYDPANLFRLNHNIRPD